MLPSMLLTLLAGPVVPLPAPDLVPLIEQVSVNHSDEGRSGFQLVFKLVRQVGVPDWLPLLTQRLKIGTRIVLIATLQAVPQVLMDGIVTHHQLAMGTEPDTATFTVTGEDVSVMLDLQELQIPKVTTDAMLVTMLLAPYAAYGMIPTVIPHPADLPPDPNEGPENQRGTAYNIIVEKANLYDYTFFVQPGPAPGQSIAYFGPRIDVPIPQRAITTNMGAANNVANLSFAHDGNAPKHIFDMVQDDSPYANAPPLPVVGLPVHPIPLAALPSAFGNLPYVHVEGLGLDGPSDYAKAAQKAVALATDASRKAVTGQGELDGARYGFVLYARGLVGVRGAGLSYDGMYYVKSVAHSIKHGEYKQSFNLQREGVLTTVPVVIP
ncbi:MAG: hypothetical protein AAGA48_20730 [Myxococcota bacterium]